MSKTIEAAAFKLVAGTDSAAFVAANHRVNAWLRVQPGFVSRELAQLEDGSWLDMVRWNSLAQAKQAGEKFMFELAECDCMRMIDPATVKMSHGALQLAA